MKTVKNRVLLFLCITAFLAMITAAFSMHFSTVKADSKSDYITGVTADKIAFEDDEIQLTMGKGVTASFARQLTVKDKDSGALTIVFTVAKEATTFSVTLTADSFDVNGNKKVEGEGEEQTVSYDKLIANVLKFESYDRGEGDDGFALDYNGKKGDVGREPNGDTRITVTFYEENNFIDVKVSANNGMISEATLENDDPYYKVKCYDRVVAKSVNLKMIDVLVAAGDDEEVAKEAVISLISVAQGADENFKQTFERDEDKTAFDTIAYPTVKLPDSCLSEGYNFLLGREYTMSFSTYSFVNSSPSLKIVPQVEGTMMVPENNTKVKFLQTGDVTFDVCDASDEEKVYGTYTVNVIDEIGKQDSNAPTYNMDDSAIESFTKAYLDKLISTDGTYVRLGSSEYLTLPSMKSMVSDNTTPYDDLKYTVYYKTPATESTYTSALKVPLAVAGEYKFFVVFEDLAGNKMTVDQFYRTDVADNNKIIYEGCEYSKYIFSFTILDDAPITVKAPTSQGDGYLGVEYTASSFTIKASSYETKYKLFFSETEDAEDDKWIEIPSLTTVKDEYDEDYNENGFTYDDLVEIAYNGNLTFIPTRMGYYKIECTVSSTSSSRLPETAYSVIAVKEKPEVVVVDNHWLQNNVWSVVFLSVGTASLIGIIVILCIKPKEETEEPVPVEKTRSKRKEK